ncbi:MAG: sugar ABC transporter permease [Spirochaetaceae bacterium]
MRKKTIKINETWDAWRLLTPLMVLMVVFILIPVLSNFYTSFTKWDLISAPKWVGFKNFITTFNDKRFLKSLENSFILITYIPVATFLPVILAAFLKEGLPGWGIFRTILYLPNVMGGVLVAILYKTFLRPDGPFNTILRSIGLSILARDWLVDSSQSIHTVGLLTILSVLGFGCIFFIAAMSSIDSSLYEAAVLDGANWWQSFIHITIPSIRFSIEFFLVLQFINVFARMFGLIYNLTFGGPGFSTYTFEFGVYVQGFQQYRYGLASAWSVILFFFCSIIAIVQIRLMKRNES